MEEATKLIRSILNLAANGLLVEEINSEYKEIIGESIPFRRFGFSTLVEYLKASNEFSGRKTVDGMRVMAKLDKNSKHIVEMRRMQNVSQAERKRRKKSTNAKANRSSMRPMRSSIYRPQNSFSAGASFNKPMPNRNIRAPRACNRFSTVESVASIKTNVRQATGISETIEKKPQKIDLHSRFVSKQELAQSQEPTATTMIPSTPTSSTVKFRPRTPPFNKQFTRTDSYVQPSVPSVPPLTTQKSKEFSCSENASVGRSLLVQQQQNCNGKPTEIDPKSPYSIWLPSSHNVQARLQVKQADKPITASLGLYSRLAMKQTNSATTQKSEQSSQLDVAASPNGRTTLIKLYQQQQQQQQPQQQQQQQEIILKNAAYNQKPPDSGSVQVKNRRDLQSRLAEKQIDQGLEMEQINQWLKNMELMEVDSADGETVARIDLKPRQNQGEMDWEETSWTRSIKKSADGFKVTVHF